MSQQHVFSEQVWYLRQQGTSIRAIASQLGVHPSRVQRAVARLPSLGPDAGDPDDVRSHQGSAFVGRELEMSVLRQALHDAAAGQGRLVLLAGEPGIGKTRLAQEFSSYAGLQGVPASAGLPPILTIVALAKRLAKTLT
jgi:transcriptional regulator with AAA-type ATPase domain